MQIPKQKQSDMLDAILNIDEKFIRFVGIVDCNAATLMSKSREDLASLVTPKDEEEFAMDLIKIKEIQEKLDEFIGKLISSHIIREKLHQFVYYVDNLIIYITCEPIVDQNRINKISQDAEFVIKDNLIGE